VRVAVNLSPLQFAAIGGGPSLPVTVAMALADSGLPGQRLELEITESVRLQDDAATLDTLHQLRGLGARISLDDFGTGYSSLSYLRCFPFDKLKIDQSFVRSLPAAGSAAIVRAVAALGSSLGIATVAEGVETEDQLRALVAEACDEMQGYLFSPPRPAADVPALLASAVAAIAA
jgi:EAL domain-containing protein (putative c-di-GMP-specific phosphodiesterase class I)